MNNNLSNAITLFVGHLIRKQSAKHAHYLKLIMSIFRLTPRELSI